MTLAPVHLTTEQAALRVRRPAGTIRYWAHRGWLSRRGQHGRATTYDLDELLAVAATRRPLPP